MKNNDFDLFKELKKMFGSVEGSINKMKEDKKQLNELEKKTSSELLEKKGFLTDENKNIYLEREKITYEVIKNIKSVKSQFEFLIDQKKCTQEQLNELNNILSVKTFKGITKIKEYDKKYSTNEKSIEIIDFILFQSDIKNSRSIDSIQIEYNKIINDSMAIIHNLQKIDID